MVSQSGNERLGIGLTWKAIQIDGPKKSKELHTMFRELGEILVDHLQGTFEDVLHYGRDLVLHESLQKSARSVI